MTQDTEILDFNLPPDDDPGYTFPEMFTEVFQRLIKKYDDKTREEILNPQMEIYYICKIPRENYEQYMNTPGNNISTALLDGILGPV